MRPASLRPPTLGGGLAAALVASSFAWAGCGPMPNIPRPGGSSPEDSSPEDVSGRDTGDVCCDIGCSTSWSVELQGAWGEGAESLELVFAFPFGDAPVTCSAEPHATAGVCSDGSTHFVPPTAERSGSVSRWSGDSAPRSPSSMTATVGGVAEPDPRPLEWFSSSYENYDCACAGWETCTSYDTVIVREATDPPAP